MCIDFIILIDVNIVNFTNTKTTNPYNHIRSDNSTVLLILPLYVLLSTVNSPLNNPPHHVENKKCPKVQTSTPPPRLQQRLM
jgi:hypothetical protein